MQHYRKSSAVCKNHFRSRTTTLRLVEMTTRWETTYWTWRVTQRRGKEAEIERTRVRWRRSYRECGRRHKLFVSKTLVRTGKSTKSALGYSLFFTHSFVCFFSCPFSLLSSWRRWDRSSFTCPSVFFPGPFSLSEPLQNSTKEVRSRPSSPLFLAKFVV